MIKCNKNYKIHEQKQTTRRLQTTTKKATGNLSKVLAIRVTL